MASVNITARDGKEMNAGFSGNNSDFNYPPVNRAASMYMPVINNDRKFKQIDTKRDWSANLYNLDIEGSFPKKFGVLCQKTNFIGKVDDIERTSSKVLHYPLNKIETNLTNNDILGSSPQCVKFKTKRNFNPLEPKYNLPKFEEIPPPVPKFIRDNLNVDGIEGAKPKKYLKWETRSMFDNKEINGNSPKKPYVRNTKYENINYSDVTHDVFKTSRCVNPLDPVYEVKYKDKETYVHGNIEGSKPVCFSQYVYPPMNLKTNDIDGANVGSKNAINKFTGQNLNLKIKDIKGTVTGSLKKGIVSERQTNPLTPKYMFPGDIELGQGKINNPYGNTLFKQEELAAGAPQKDLNVNVNNESRGSIMSKGSRGSQHSVARSHSQKPRDSKQFSRKMSENVVKTPQS